MKIYKTSIIGQFHLNHNEDYFIVEKIGNEKILIAVMDGCTMGIDSHFSSTLIGKILRKAAKSLDYREFYEKRSYEIESTLKSILKDLFEELISIKNNLDLLIEELLSTVILGIINFKERTGHLITIGDGIIYCDGLLKEYDQENKPDYIGYHLNKPFKEFYENQNQIFNCQNIKNLSICTDGIFTFKEFNEIEYEQISDEEIISFLLIDSKHNENENMLNKKLSILKRKFGLIPTDDLTILRLSLE